MLNLPTTVSSFVFHKSHHPFIPPVHLQVDSSNPLAPQSDQPFRIRDLREEIPYEMQKVTYGIYMSCTIYIHVISIHVYVVHVIYILIPYNYYISSMSYLVSKVTVLVQK